MTPELQQLTDRAELLTQPETGSLHVPQLGVTIRWEIAGCTVVANEKEHAINETSGVSLQISTWQSPPEISWFRPDKPGVHWLGVEFYVPRKRGRAVGKDRRVRLKAPISAEAARALPRLELDKAAEVERDGLIVAIGALRYHGADLSRGTAGLGSEDRKLVQTSRWWQPVEFTLLGFGAIALAVSMLLSFRDHSLAFPGTLLAASLGIHAVVQSRWARILHREFGLPSENPSFGLFTAGTSLLVLASVAVPILFARIGAVGAAILWGLSFSAVVWLSASELRRAAERHRPPPEGIPARPDEGRGAILFFFSHGGVPALMFIALGLTAGDWRPLVGAVLWLYMLARYLWVIFKLSRQEIWPDWRGPAGSVDRRLIKAAQATLGNMANPSITFHGLMLIRIGLILMPVGLTLIGLGSQLSGVALTAVPVVVLAIWLFERFVIAELKVETWGLIPFFGLNP